ncbi:uncharacterized protein LOC110110708 [Dendrobium catenatum]|uniref:uncharacterized protein LOC110110708 n=1 Tax=Dendrobium catenatum TaxID=906689 RepID=UPI0009F2AE9D|nr:uncharacterized protein LOC110110708 [Dendrobium catenatum]
MSLPNFASWNVRGLNNPDKVGFCKSLINSHDLKMLCILEAKISQSLLDDSWFLNSHLLFENECSCNNFNDASPGRIWLKWDSSVFTFNTLITSPQLIHGVLSAGSFPPIFLSVVYASNSLEERRSLWNLLVDLIPPSDKPWVILGDFNCCRFDTEKAGGSTLSDFRLGELNNMVFNCGVQDLSSTVLFYTWYNQRVDDPIHIKLDRVLVNPALLDYLPLAYYKVDSPLGSDHSPLIFMPSHVKPISSRFLFKNYWINMDDFLDEVFTAFASRSSKSPLASFFHSLHSLKRSIKNKNWPSASFISNSILDLKSKQLNCLLEIQNQPLNLDLNTNLIGINDQLAALQSHWFSWISQSAKALWLTHGEDDLGFLFAKIRSKNNKNCIKEITTFEGHFFSHAEVSKAIVKHFKDLYNPLNVFIAPSSQIPPGKMVPDQFHSMLVAPVSFEEVKLAVFYGNMNSAPGPDGFSYAFYRKSWHIIGIKCLMRPISLCNVLYKIVAKILATRLKAVLPMIIHESQSGFIANRCSTDYIILASEILRDFKGSGKKFCAKLDIKKAFDSISRDFLISRLIQKGFPANFVSWIKGCISEDSSFSMLWDPWLKGNLIAETYNLPVLANKMGCDILDKSEVLWNGSSKWVFKAFTDHFYSHLPKVDWFSSIWHKNFALKYACFAWMAIIEKLKTADNLMIRARPSSDQRLATDLRRTFARQPSIAGLQPDLYRTTARPPTAAEPSPGQ